MAIIIGTPFRELREGSRTPPPRTRAATPARWPRRSARRSRASAASPAPARASCPRPTSAWIRSRTIVSMFRYSTTSILSLSRPWPGHDHRAALLVVGGHRQLDDPVQRGNHAVDAAALRPVEHRIADGREHVAGHDHVGPPEEDDAVAVGVRVRLVQHLHRLVVEEEVVLVVEERVARATRPRGRAVPPPATVGAHPVQHVLVRDDAGVAAGVAAEAAAERHAVRPRRARLGQRLVAAGVILAGLGVDDEVNRLVGNACGWRRAPRSTASRGSVSTTSTPSVARVHHHVALGRDEHVDLSLDVQHLHLAGRRRRQRRPSFIDGAGRGGRRAGRIGLRRATAGDRLGQLVAVAKFLADTGSCPAGSAAPRPRAAPPPRPACT